VLDPILRQQLEELAKAQGVSPEEAFVALSREGTGPLGPEARQQACRTLQSQYSECERARGSCSSQCSEPVCRSRASTLECDVAPRCNISC
jgi:hypothetical protein